MNEPWKTDRWFTSPWNFAPEVRSQLHFAKKIKLHDVTLRDGEQQAGIVFRKEDKIRIAEKLAEVGIHRIEAGMPAVSKQDEEAIKEIVKRNLGPEIFAFARCMVDDVKRAVDCGVKGIVVEIPSSEHLIKYAYKWDMAKAIDLSVKATTYAHEQGLYTVFFPIDCSRSDMKWVLDLLTTVAKDGWMDACAIVDTFGGLMPHAVPYLIKSVKERIPDKPIEVHFHDDFGLGSANTLMALAAGADVAHTTVSAIGERAGNTAYEEVALALLTMYNVDIGLKTEKFVETSKLVQELAKVTVRPNKGILGDMLFKIESGIVTSWWVNVKDEHPLEVVPYHWNLIGQQEPEPVLGKNNGIDSVNFYLQKLGLNCPEEKKMDLLQAIKAKSFEKKGLLTEYDFKKLVKEVVG
ncbi:MAG TPA: pyruvate carboxyltransferase [Firmicutes bacterium]|nr:pyruvate carboxyltransferase [Bacillota bacterium]